MIIHNLHYTAQPFQPLSLVKVVKPRVDTTKASIKTVRSRAHQMSSYRSVVSGECGTQQLLLTHEVKALTKEQREELLCTFQAPVALAAEDVLALKASLMIPWNKLRALRR